MGGPDSRPAGIRPGADGGAAAEEDEEEEGGTADELVDNVDWTNSELAGTNAGAEPRRDANSGPHPDAA